MLIILLKAYMIKYFLVISQKPFKLYIEGGQLLMILN